MRTTPIHGFTDLVTEYASRIVLKRGVLILGSLLFFRLNMGVSLGEQGRYHQGGAGPSVDPGVNRDTSAAPDEASQS